MVDKGKSNWGKEREGKGVGKIFMYNGERQEGDRGEGD